MPASDDQGEITDAAARRLLERAAEIQSERQLSLTTKRHGSDLKLAAKEVGIDESCLELAAQELGLSLDAVKAKPLKEMDLALVMERVVPDRLSEKLQGALVHAADGSTGVIGEVTERPTGFIWRSGKQAPRDITMVVHDDGRRTHVRLTQNLKSLNMAATIALGGAGATAALLASAIVQLLGLPPSQAIGLSLAAGVGVGIGFAFTAGMRLHRYLLRTWSSPLARELQLMADELVASAEGEDEDQDLDD